MADDPKLTVAVGGKAVPIQEVVEHLFGAPSRCLLFAGNEYYPYGGWRDFVGLFPDIDAAKAKFESIKDQMIHPWAHIVNDQGKIVCLINIRYEGDIEGWQDGSDTMRWDES